MHENQKRCNEYGSDAHAVDELPSVCRVMCRDVSITVLLSVVNVFVVISEHGVRNVCIV
jgi:hypothetical protein